MVLPTQHLHNLVFGECPMILSDEPISDEQIQTASFDCRLGSEVYAMKSAALPHTGTVAELIKNYYRYSFSLSRGKTNVLEKNVCYLIPLKERLALSEDFCAVFSPKSSTGRCDVFVRVISDYAPYYDRTAFGYHGQLYLEVIPLSFNVRICEGLELTQCRILPRDAQRISGTEVASFHSRDGILRSKHGEPIPNGDLHIIDGGLYYAIDLQREVVGFQALDTPIEELDLTQKGGQDPSNFWLPIERPKNGQLVLSPGAFYLLATAERTVIPPELCGEILPYDISSGEFRPHYAGFFDNGFGGEGGTTGVLEVRCRDVPFRLVHGQGICRMVFYRTCEVPDRLYDGHYAQSGPSLSKHFKDRFEAWGDE